MSNLNPKTVEAALRNIISGLDYDLHKQIECDEETGWDMYPRLAEGFRMAYEAAQ